MTYDIICADCGHEHTAASPRAKYCNVCRIWRDLTFVGDTTKACFGCGEKFAPVRRKDLLCSNCDYNHTIYATGPCAICKASSTTTMRSDIAVCVDCMRKPGETRRLFVRAIHKKRADRLAVAA
jgi:hypothetical protein